MEAALAEVDHAHDGRMETAGLLQLGRRRTGRWWRWRQTLQLGIDLFRFLVQLLGAQWEGEIASTDCKKWREVILLLTYRLFEFVNQPLLAGKLERPLAAHLLPLLGGGQFVRRPFLRFIAGGGRLVARCHTVRKQHGFFGRRRAANGRFEGEYATLVIRSR